jgi:hypothetical protein
MSRTYLRLGLLAAALWLGDSPLSLRAQQETPAAGSPSPAADTPAAETPAADAPAVSLADQQNQLAEKYRRLEDLIFKMADFEATTNPRRAELLKQAYKQSKDRLTQTQLAAIVALLAEKQYKRAIDGQEIARKDLEELLQLLLSEDRSDRLKTEAQRAVEAIKELKRLQRLQRSMRGQTEGGIDPKELAPKQGQLADRTGELAQQLEEADAKGEAGQTPPAESGSDQPAETEATPPTDAEDKPPAEGSKEPSGEQPPASDQAKPPGEPQTPAPDAPPSEAPPKEPAQSEPTPGEPTPGEPSQGEPSQGEPSDSPPPQGQGSPEPSPPQPPPEDASPAKRRVREAEQRMREAQQKLEESKRSESVEKQTEALQKLEEAIAELEEVLRQLREEEMERVLALLEGRFRQMLEEEIKIYEATQRLDAIPEAERNRDLDIRANKLAFDQRKVASQADRCLTLLLEEGSSVAFPEVVEQIRDDMESVSDRLAEAKVGTITQDMEQEIISSLEEMIAAFQKAQQELDQPKPPSPGQPGQPGERPLVDSLAELKMIRSLQVRINVRTQRYAKLLQNVDDPIGQAQTDDLRQALQELGEREANVQKITRDIVLGKNE